MFFMHEPSKNLVMNYLFIYLFMNFLTENFCEQPKYTAKKIVSG